MRNAACWKSIAIAGLIHMHRYKFSHLSSLKRMDLNLKAASSAKFLRNISVAAVVLSIQGTGCEEYYIKCNHSKFANSDASVLCCSCYNCNILYVCVWIFVNKCCICKLCCSRSTAHWLLRSVDSNWFRINNRVPTVGSFAGMWDCNNERLREHRFYWYYELQHGYL